MRLLLALLLSFTSALALSGCASAPEDASDPSAVYAECPCCKCNADLACMRVKVGPDTPHVVVDGVTYWFCSDECRNDFVADPKKYVRH